MKKKIAFYTFGCRLNQSETAVIRQGFDPREYDVVDYRNEPDVVVVNTCTVTENGDADTRRLVNRVRRINPKVEIALVGCQAQVQKKQLLDLPNVRWVVGNARKFDMADILTEGGPEKQLITPTIRKDSFTVPFVGFKQNLTRANLKIQDGCDFFCSFCEIPFARGRARSREFDDILNEAVQLTDAGHRELVLTGINIGTYDYDGKSLVDVIEALEELHGLERIRISSIEPTTIADQIIQKMADSSKLCRYLHIPLQAGSDAVLEAMKRKYTIAEFVDFLSRAQDTVPGICLGTDVIVGFPGETDDHFEETYNLLLDLPFAYFHVFSYSDRDHAKSSNFEGKIDRGVVAERSRRLRELSQRKRRIYNQQFLGDTAPVLFEQQKQGFWNGVTETYIRVKVESELDLKNQILPVRLAEIEGQAIIGALA